MTYANPAFPRDARGGGAMPKNTIVGAGGAGGREVLEDPVLQTLMERWEEGKIHLDTKNQMRDFMNMIYHCGLKDKKNTDAKTTPIDNFRTQ